MVKRLLILALINAAFAFGAAFTQANESNKMIVVTEEWPPYNYTNLDGNVVGISTEMVEQTLTNSNIPYTINSYPWVRSYELALSKPNVLLYSTVRIPEREQFFHWVCPLHLVEYSVFKLASRKDIVINSLNDLKKYSTGITRGTFLDSFFEREKLTYGVHLQVSSNNQVSFQNLINERVDLIIDTQQYIDRQLGKLELVPDYIRSAYKLNGGDSGKMELCMAISLKTPMALVNKIKAEHQKLVKAQSD